MTEKENAVSYDLDELQQLPLDLAAEENTPCEPAVQAQMPTFTTVC